jgi:hypothetical protein
VVWNNQAGELWRRTKQAMEHYLAHIARHRGVPFFRVPCGEGRYRWVSAYRIAHGKAAEYLWGSRTRPPMLTWTSMRLARIR